MGIPQPNKNNCTKAIMGLVPQMMMKWDYATAAVSNVVGSGHQPSHKSNANQRYAFTGHQQALFFHIRRSEEKKKFHIELNNPILSRYHLVFELWSFIPTPVCFMRAFDHCGIQNGSDWHRETVQNFQFEGQTPSIWNLTWRKIKKAIMLRIVDCRL